MKNIKQFCKEHKKELILTGVVVGAVVTGLLVKGRSKKNLIDVTGKNAITWVPGPGFMNLERVKEILDLNANNTESFAIFREPGNAMDQYTCVLLSDNVVLNKAV
jgi:phage host-nuclease inhibitor protein Gam